MGDPLNVVTNITAIVQLGESVVGYISDVRDAPKERNRILIEISSANSLLFALKGLISKAESGDIWLPIIQSLDVPNGPLAQLRSALERLAVHLECSTLRWPFQKKEVEEIFEHDRAAEDIIHPCYSK